MWVRFKKSTLQKLESLLFPMGFKRWLINSVAGPCGRKGLTPRRRHPRQDWSMSLGIFGRDVVMLQNQEWCRGIVFQQGSELGYPQFTHAKPHVSLSMLYISESPLVLKLSEIDLQTSRYFGDFSCETHCTTRFLGQSHRVVSLNAKDLFSGSFHFQLPSAPVFLEPFMKSLSGW